MKNGNKDKSSDLYTVWKIKEKEMKNAKLSDNFWIDYFNQPFIRHFLLLNEFFHSTISIKEWVD